MIQHLYDVNLTYVEHFFVSNNFCKMFLIAAAKAFVHSILPDVYTTSSTDILTQTCTLNETMKIDEL